jgi:putrescine transport system substrate-binding protein
VEASDKAASTCRRVGEASRWWCHPREVSIFRLLVVLLVLVPFTARSADRVVHVYNWTDYMDPYALQRFTAETGIKVVYDVYDSLETLEAKLLAGKSGYDVVVPTSEPTFSRLVRANALMKLDKAALPYLAGLDPTLVARVAASDPGNAFGAIYLWGTIGLGINPAKAAALDPGATLDTWDLLLKPEHAARLAKCGITMLDSAIDVIPSVLHYLGKSPDSGNPDDLALVEATLRKIRPYIRNFEGGGAVDALASGETCLALSYSGDVIQAAARAEEAKRGAVVYIAPREGTQLWFDMLAVPADAPHPAEAMALIDFLLRPDVIAGITNQVRYPNAVQASLATVDKAISGNSDIYPPQQKLAGMFTIGAVDQATARARSRMWARFKAGR